MTAVVQIGSSTVRLACGTKRSGFCACARAGAASVPAANAGTAFSRSRRRIGAFPIYLLLAAIVTEPACVATKRATLTPGPHRAPLAKTEDESPWSPHLSRRNL